MFSEPHTHTYMLNKKTTVNNTLERADRNNQGQFLGFMPAFIWKAKVIP
jgi:hypothetical protein